ncbi:HIT domain-containing protein [Geobacter sp. FeAm09]|uniref:HIT family protein n=1 Tax=Geobacter sp. FeAm09 TaxID=2597769 RepID=UPI0011EF9EB9|nr:HIT domain-containing protein [Geobacter sp. FeAm09]QEM67888.1 HIT domain-containing protein [Geobacter sp. FeAm09]
MERIWAPWRMAYINNPAPQEGCIFCKAWEENDDRERLVLARSRHSLIMMNRYPYSGGHLMAAPARHVSDMDDLSDAELLDLMQSVRRAHNLLRAVANPQGFNMGINLGKAAGAGIEDHMHIHIVPRWNGDTNFMSVVGNVRVIPEGLMETYDRLSEEITAGAAKG